MTLSRRDLGHWGLAAGAGLLGLAGCSNDDPLAPATSGGDAGSQAAGVLVVGSQQYYSNEIIAELYAQVLEKAGLTVKRQYQIGQREVYLPEIKAGRIDVFPEYTGNLMQYLDKNAKATDEAGIQEAISKALPDGLRVLKPATASDQDSYTVTPEFAAKHGLKSIADLAKAGKVKIAANSEFAERPYGPKGAKSAYGIDVEVLPVEDSGGPLTVKALLDGKAQVADLYTASPVIAEKKLVVLEDPKNLILPQQVVPVVSKKVDDKAAAAIDAVNAKLTPEVLQKLNAQSVSEKKKSKEIASGWLTEQGLL